ncbi:DUF4296 domain-containing protein [Mucilaginibacter sp. AK015]|uniref:DUF4296 domain-containing protein n=1 Tax=Mucilaginibacter sp. AK015 TaxID=2723072 RepID=UPI001617C727|nr:DUF4296 domain-containing protein [Mucilaginibacter sp. AK015]MBB5394500.1 hypothetical protein [Mucilaginibacter sp. AK015]
MQKYISLFFSVLLGLTACQSNQLPEGVMKEQQMISLLTDIHLTDGEIYMVPQIPDSMYKYASAKFNNVFKKHHTTDAAFKKSLKYYTTQPEQLQDMYNKIDAILKAKLDSTNKAAIKPKPEAPTKTPDTIKRADTARTANPLHRTKGNKHLLKSVQ